MPSFIELAAVDVVRVESGEVLVLEADVEPEDCRPDEPAGVIEVCGATESLDEVSRSEA